MNEAHNLISVISHPRRPVLTSHLKALKFILNKQTNKWLSWQSRCPSFLGRETWQAEISWLHVLVKWQNTIEQGNLASWDFFYSPSKDALSLIFIHDKLVFTLHLLQIHMPDGTAFRGGVAQLRWYTRSHVSHIRSSPLCLHTAHESSCSSS